jgi:hypothetical protein
VPRMISPIQEEKSPGKSDALWFAFSILTFGGIKHVKDDIKISGLRSRQEMIDRRTVELDIDST